jgi:hypothetical protein
MKTRVRTASLIRASGMRMKTAKCTDMIMRRLTPMAMIIHMITDIRMATVTRMVTTTRTRTNMDTTIHTTHNTH